MLNPTDSGNNFLKKKKKRGVLKGFSCKPANGLRKYTWLPVENSTVGLLCEPSKPFDKMHMSCKEEMTGIQFSQNDTCSKEEENFFPSERTPRTKGIKLHRH